MSYDFFPDLIENLIDQDMNAIGANYKTVSLTGAIVFISLSLITTVFSLIIRA